MHQNLNITAETPERTEAAAAALSCVLRGGEVILLEGDLGAGKTYFTRALAHALGVAGHVTSPTFVLQKNYRTPGGAVRAIAHYDVYRMGDYGELADIGFEDLPDDAIALVEWGERFLGSYHVEPVRVRLEYAGEESRRIEFIVPDADQGSMLEKELASAGFVMLSGDA